MDSSFNDFLKSIEFDIMSKDLPLQKYEENIVLTVLLDKLSNKRLINIANKLNTKKSTLARNIIENAIPDLEKVVGINVDAGYIKNLIDEIENEKSDENE